MPTYLESAFSLYSIDVNFDNSQSNIGIMWKGAFFGIVFVSERNTAKVGLSFPYLYYRESKPYVKDKVGMKAPLSFYALIKFNI